jgi:hypothetical protein
MAVSVLHLPFLSLLTLFSQFGFSKALNLHPIGYHVDSTLSSPSSFLSTNGGHPPQSPSSLLLSLSTTL